MKNDQVFTLLGEGKRINGRLFEKIKCECGTVKYTRKDHILSGKTKSCGCLIKRKSENYIRRGDEAANYRHGDAMPEGEHYNLYRKYHGMKNRCYKKDDINYENYGGRGIKVCDEWLESYQSFKKWALNNGYKESLTIDRIDNNGNYEPDNCRWADVVVQANNKRNNLNIEIDGEVKTLAEWCRIYKVDYFLARGRLIQGKVGKELFEPLKNRLWTKEEDEFIKRNVELMSKRDMAKRLNRTLNSVRNRWKKLRREIKEVSE